MSLSKRHRLEGDWHASIWNYFLFPIVMWCPGNRRFALWAGEGDANLLSYSSSPRINQCISDLQARLFQIRHRMSGFLLAHHMVNNTIYIKGRWQCYMCRWRALIKKQAWVLSFPVRSVYFSWSGALHCSALPLPSYIPYSICLPCPTGHPAVYLSIASHE